MPLTARNLWELVEARAAATPDAEMLVDEAGTRMSFLEYRDAAERMAAGFHELGIGAGDVVTWELPTWLDTIVLASALSRLGAVQNPIIAIYREREVGFCCRQAGAKLLVTHGATPSFDFGAMGAKIAVETEGLSHLAVERGGFPSGDPANLPPAPDSDGTDLRWLCYTSGTTADPKGAKHTDSSIHAIGLAMAERLDVEEGDRPSLVFPFPHIGGLTWLFSSLQFGAALLADAAFNPATTIPLLAREGCTHPGAGTPFHMAYLAAQRADPDNRLFPTVKNFPGGGAPKPPTLHAEMKAEFGGNGVVSGWGLTEAPILTMGADSDPDHKLAATEGRAMPGVDLRAVKLDGTIAASGEEGELRAKAPQMMLGYLDSSLDEEAFDDDGYFRTGDLGIIDEDGFVIISGRLKDVIIRHGENISAKEVEDLLFPHPQVQDVAVVGLPDPVTGERACAVVATAEGAEPLDMATMQAFLKAEGLRANAIPEQIEYTDAIPRNPSGKITKNVLRDELAERHFER
jgi:acyl-CoA synthetase (AMP-forming)/AMP-acid ligase II